MTTDHHQPLLSIAEAARLLERHVRTVKKLIDRGILRAQVVDGMPFIGLSDLRAYVGANAKKRAPSGSSGRRRNGEGTYDQLPNGKIRYWLSPEPDGYRPSGVGKTYEEARRNTERNREKYRKSRIGTTSDTTIENFAPYWIKIAGRNKEETSKSDDQHRFNSRINPYIGKKKFSKLDFFLFQELVDTWEYDDEYSPSTIKGDFTRLRALIRFARGIRLIDFDPTEQVVLPRIDSPKRAISVEQLRLRRRAWVIHPHSLLYDYYAFLGLRRGEGLGLLASNLNRETRSIRITHQVKPINGKPILVPRTKTPSGERELPLPDMLFERTITTIESLEALKALAGRNWQDQGLLFPNELGGPQVPSTINHMFADIQTKAGLELIRLNDLRHTFATLVRSELGYDQDIVGAMLGHKHRNVTGHYAQILPPLMREPVERLENLILGRNP